MLLIFLRISTVFVCCILLMTTGDPFRTVMGDEDVSTTSAYTLDANNALSWLKQAVRRFSLFAFVPPDRYFAKSTFNLSHYGIDPDW